MNQRTSPCSGCPFSKHIEPGALGGSPVEVYVGQSHLPFWLPCHQSENYCVKDSRFEEVEQCAGAAIFRSNIGAVVPPPLLRLPPDKHKAFADIFDFYAHHQGVSRDEAMEALPVERIRELAVKELTNAQAKVQFVRREP